MKQVYEWVVKIRVAPNLVADGFDLDREVMHNMLMRALPFAYGQELGAEIIEAPNPDDIAIEQGYLHAAHKRTSQEDWRNTPTKKEKL